MKASLWISTLALAVTFSFAQAEAGDNMKHGSGHTAADKDKEPLDARTFVDKAARGGMAEVQLGQMAQQKGMSNEVKQFGLQMVTDHTKANDELKALAAQKKLDVPTDVGPDHRKEMDRLTGLSGAAFDRAYMEVMVMDHEKTVNLFERASKTVQDPDLKAWADKTLPTLRQHLEHARTTQNKVKGTAAR